MSKSGLIATVAFYGPNDQIATKAVVRILTKDKLVQDSRTWVSSTMDVREDETIRAEMVDYIKSQKVEHATATEQVIGCPHEAGIDYPAGGFCPMCDFWKAQMPRR